MAAHLLHLRKRFLDGLPDRAAELVQAVDAWTRAASPETAEQARLAIASALHRLAGAAGIHGLMPLCGQAHQLEDAVATAAGPSAALRSALDALSASLLLPHDDAGTGDPAG
ncbi:Hpt domain-containing protein [Ralstonia solanacearum]|nr:Hpt domain-containing protein [Ralstonia solanacearum]